MGLFKWNTYVKKQVAPLPCGTGLIHKTDTPNLYDLKTRIVRTELMVQELQIQITKMKEDGYGNV